MIKTQKKILATSDLLPLLPGEGSGILRLFLSARWLAPCVPGKRPLYRAEDVDACLDRLGKGELPEPIWRWRTAIGQDSAHLVDAHGKPSCNCREREWMDSMAVTRQCTRCQGAAKSLRVEET